VPEALDYEAQTARDYTRGTEAERLRLERIEPWIVGDLYEHGKVWTPWQPAEAVKMRATARAILHDPNHPADHHGDYSDAAVSSCAFCTLHGIAAAMYGPRADDDDDDPPTTPTNPPNYSGWERIYVQAGVTIPDHWREAFAWWLTADGEAENARYADALGRDVATFGLREQRGHVRAPQQTV